MRLGHCWNANSDRPVPGSREPRVEWLMRRSRIWRIHVRYEDSGFDPDFPMFTASGQSLRTVLHRCWNYRMMPLPVFDGHYGGEHPSNYHRRDPQLSVPKLRRYFGQVIEFWTSGWPKLKPWAVEIFNEFDFLPQVPRDRPTEVLAWYPPYRRAFDALGGLVRRTWADVPLIVGGASCVHWRNLQGNPPSISAWMSDFYNRSDRVWLAWHPSERWTPETIRQGNAALRAFGLPVVVTEDVYQDGLLVYDRAMASRRGGAKAYFAWARWDFDPAWGGEKAAPEGPGERWSRARARQFDRVSADLGERRLGLKPRSVKPPPEPPPLSEEQRVLRLLLAVARADDPSLTPDQLVRTARFRELADRPILKRFLE